MTPLKNTMETQPYGKPHPMKTTLTSVLSIALASSLLAKEKQISIQLSVEDASGRFLHFRKVPDLHSAD